MLQKRDPREAQWELFRQSVTQELERAQKNMSVRRKPEVGVEGLGCFGAGLFGGLSCLLSVLLCYGLITGKFDKFVSSFREETAPAWKGKTWSVQDDVADTLARGSAFYYGTGAPKDLRTAFAHFLKAANAGNAIAQFQVGRMLLSGEGVAKDREVALSWLRKSAAQGYAEAWLALGSLYVEGEGTPKDREEVLSWLREAAGRGNAEAQDILKKFEEDMAMDSLPAEEMLARAYACLEGGGVPQDKAEAARWFRKAAMKDNAEAQHQLAMLYLRGDGVERDTVKTADWLRKAANQGYGAALSQLALMYEKGIGVPQDKAQAVECYRRAAEQGHAEAQCRFARLCRTGEGVPQDKAQAAEWYRKAAGQGCAEAQCNLGVLYGTGEGVAQDKAQARKWFRKAAEQGLDEAQYHLGIIFFEGDGVPQDIREAVRWLRKAANKGHREAWQLLHHGDEKLRAAYEEDRKAEWAEQERTRREELIRQAQTGDPEKQYDLAQAYALGHYGLPQDMSQIVAWLRKAGEQGHLPAQTKLATIYYDGEKVPQDKAEAAVWLRKAAGQGDVKSQEKLARMYHTGDGIPRDGKQAVFWYGKLAEKGSVDSMMTIAGIYARGDGVPRDMEQVVVWGREAALLGNTLAPIRLGRMYAEGNGVPRDMDKAILWYHWAARAFNDEAMLELGRIYAEGDGVPQDKWLAAAWYMRIDTGDYRIEEKVRKALQALEVDENVINAWKEVLDSVQETRMEVARFELSRGVDKIGRSEEGKEKFSVLSINAERACSAFLEEWKKLERAGSNIPPQIRDMAASVAFEAEKTLRVIETAGKSEQPAVFL